MELPPILRFLPIPRLGLPHAPIDPLRPPASSSFPAQACLVPGPFLIIIFMNLHSLTHVPVRTKRLSVTAPSPRSTSILVVVSGEWCTSLTPPLPPLYVRLPDTTHNIYSEQYAVSVADTPNLPPPAPLRARLSHATFVFGTIIMSST